MEKRGSAPASAFNSHPHIFEICPVRKCGGRDDILGRLVQVHQVERRDDGIYVQLDETVKAELKDCDK